ncbi:MAG: lamin tail domain-containing protein [Chitinophagales bacterium]
MRKRKSTLILCLLIIFGTEGIAQKNNESATLYSPSKESGGYSIAITEIMYHADSSIQSQDWVELYNYGGAAVNISGWKLKDQNILNTYTIPGGTYLNPGEYLVIAQRLDTFQMIYPEVSNVIGSFAFGLNNTSDKVRLLDNSNNTVVEINYIDSMPWPSAADGIGPSLQIKNLDAIFDDPANWFPGCVGGTPGSGYVPCNYDIIVSEINYNSAPFFLVGDWIELLNRTNSAINISGWQFRDRNANIFTFPTGTILESNARLVVSDSLDAITSMFSELTNVIGEFDFGLSNGGDAVLLYNADIVLQYSVRFNDKLPWPEDADGDGYTIEFTEEGDNPNIATNWIAGCPLGSPGIPFTLPCPTLHIHETNASDLQVFPNPFSDYLIIELSRFSRDKIQYCFITDMGGRAIKHFELSNNERIMWGETVASGIYALHVITESGMHYTQKIIRN